MLRQTQYLYTNLLQVACNGLTILEYETFCQMIQTSGEFESQAEKEWYSTSGYEDLHIREDEEERKRFAMLRNVTLPLIEDKEEDK